MSGGIQTLSRKYSIFLFRINTHKKQKKKQKNNNNLCLRVSPPIFINNRSVYEAPNSFRWCWTNKKKTQKILLTTVIMMIIRTENNIQIRNIHSILPTHVIIFGWFCIKFSVFLLLHRVRLDWDLRLGTVLQRQPHQQIYCCMYISFLLIWCVCVLSLSNMHHTLYSKFRDDFIR